MITKKIQKEIIDRYVDLEVEIDEGKLCMFNQLISIEINGEEYEIDRVLFTNTNIIGIDHTKQSEEFDVMFDENYDAVKSIDGYKGD